MSDAVKGRPGRSTTTRRSRAQTVAETEERILTAAARLFEQDGYAATTLAGVAGAAGVADRTVYVRFGTKVALFSRVVDVAVVGDTGPEDVATRARGGPSMTAPTAQERIRDMCHIGRLIMERTGRLFAVAQEAAASEPVLQEAWQAARLGTRQDIGAFWTAMADDGLLPKGVDQTWLADTATVVASAETYLLVSRMYGWDLDEYERWLQTSFEALLRSVAG